MVAADQDHRRQVRQSVEDFPLFSLVHCRDILHFLIADQGNTVLVIVGEIPHEFQTGTVDVRNGDFPFQRFRVSDDLPVSEILVEIFYGYGLVHHFTSNTFFKYSPV